jgi:glycosyltransferase involved in cell wall biosynthesis
MEFLGLSESGIRGLNFFLPLRLASMVGVLSAFIALVFGSLIIIKKFLYGDPVAGYASLVVLITFIGGIQLLALGVIGEYLGRVFNETKNRPLYLVKDIQKSRYPANQKDNKS